MGKVAWAGFIVALLGSVSTASAAGIGNLEKFDGHLSIGYAKLFATRAPGGSISFAGGVDYPIAEGLRAGVDIGYHLLGSRSEERGSLVASVDYSLFEAVAFAHWIPSSGPVGRVSMGPALVSARAELSTSGGGAGFTDLAVEDVAPGFAFQATLIRRSASPVRVGLEFGILLGFVEPEDWTLATARVTFHY